MTSSIILKKSSVAARVPVPGDLAYGELALNYADGALYYKRSDNTIQNLIAAAGSSSSPLSIGTTAPTNPTATPLWWQSDTGILKVYYPDADSSQWVDATPAGFSTSGGSGGGATTDDVIALIIALG